NTSSTVEVQGNIISSNTASVGGGTVLLLVNGTGAQTINDNQGASISGKLPNLKINKSSGTLSLYGSIGMGGSTTLEYVAGTISAGTSRLLCYYNNTLYNHSSGSLILSKLDFIGSGGTQTVTGKIMVSDTFSTSGTGNCVIDGDTLELQGKMIWNNTSAGSGGSVTYKLTGSNAQTISGAASLPLYDLIISKTSGDVTLQKEVKISHNLKFVTGYIVSDAINLLTIKHGATVSGVSASSFVRGPVKKIGTSAFNFPIGKGTNYNALEITAPSNSTDAFTAEYFGSNQSNGTSKDSLTYLSNCEYWNLARTTGSSNVKVTLHLNTNSCDIYTLSTLKVARWDGSKWNNLGTVTTAGNTTSGTVQTNSNQSSFGDFIIAKRSPTVYASAGANRAVCEGISTNLGGSPSASGGLTPLGYSWSPSSGLSSSTTPNPTATPLETTNYILTVTDLDHTIASDTVNVIVNPNPAADAGEDTIACKGFESYIGGSPTASDGIEPYSYVWENAIGDTIFDSPNPFLELDSTTQLFLSVSDSNGCIANDTLQILMSAPIVINSNIDTALFLNQSTVLNPDVSGGTGTLSYLWNPGKWLSDSTIRNPVCNPLSTTYYTFEVQDSLGCKKEIYPRVSFSPIDLGDLFNFAAFQADSIIGGDSSIAIGGIASRYLDDNLRLEKGFRSNDTVVINLLEIMLDGIINQIDTLDADTIDQVLDNDTLTSGIYRITSSASLNGNLTLLGNDSSYFVIDIDADFEIEDLSQINAIGVNPDKVFFSVNGDIIIGDSVFLSGILISSQKITANSFSGRPAMLSSEKITIETQGLKLVALDNNGDFNKPNCAPSNDLSTLYDCPIWGNNDHIGIAVPKMGSANGFNSSDYKLVFEDQFNGLLDISTEDADDTDRKWIEWDFMAPADKDGNNYVYFNYPGEEMYKVDGGGNLILLLKNKHPEFYDDPHCYFTSGQIISSETFYHGYFEIRAKLPRGEGVWPAFWMIAGDCPGDDENHPLRQDQREIDFFDGYWKKNALPMAQFINTVPCDGSSISHIACTYDDVCEKALNLADDWHIYACDWQNDFITYFIDNVPVAIVDLTHTDANLMGKRDEAMHLVLTNGVTSPYVDAGFMSDKEETAQDPLANEHYFQIDYVRVWQKKNHVSDGYFTDATTFTKASKFATHCEFTVNTSRFAPETQYHWSIPPISLVNPNNYYLQFTGPGGGSDPVDIWNENWELLASEPG
ncbi:MAG TPA: family 16 glycosylhydrolase, partial [Saprospiraceae bacterium]|nr:family 16 glycosylhydrolase [Saprospiraceae bacterium]